VYSFKRKFKQIQRVISFLPIIWRGYDWDYSYAIEIFKHQLTRLADSMEGDDALALNSKKTAGKIRTAINLMEKVYDEEYACEYIDQIESKYGEEETEFIESGKTPHGEPYYTMKTIHPLAVDENHQKLISDERTQLFRDSQLKQKKAHRILWKYIEHNIQHWWD